MCFYFSHKFKSAPLHNFPICLQIICMIWMQNKSECVERRWSLSECIHAGVALGHPGSEIAHAKACWGCVGLIRHSQPAQLVLFSPLPLSLSAAAARWYWLSRCLQSKHEAVSSIQGPTRLPPSLPPPLCTCVIHVPARAYVTRSHTNLPWPWFFHPPPLTFAPNRNTEHLHRNIDPRALHFCFKSQLFY